MNLTCPYCHEKFIVIQPWLATMSGPIYVMFA